MSLLDTVVGLAMLVFAFQWGQANSENAATTVGGVASVAMLLFVAVVWWKWRRNRRAMAARKTLAELRAMDPVQFERWVGQRFREQGYRVQTTALSGDHGIDLVLQRGGERAIVQCKRYAAGNTVGEGTVRELLGAMHGSGASKAFLVTTSQFTAPAAKWAQGKPLELWDGSRLSQYSASDDEDGSDLPIDEAPIPRQAVDAPSPRTRRRAPSGEGVRR